MQRRRFCEISKPRHNGFVRCGRAYDKLARARNGRRRVITARGGSSALQTQGPLKTMQTSAWARYRRIVTIDLSAHIERQVDLKRYAKKVERGAAIDRELSDGLSAAGERAVQTRHAGYGAGNFEIY